jgi:hypothetical protein
VHQRDICLCDPCIRTELARDFELDKDDAALQAGKQPKGPEPVVLHMGVVRRQKKAA